MNAFEEFKIFGNYVLRFYPTDNGGWMCGISNEMLRELQSESELEQFRLAARAIIKESKGEEC